MSFSTTPAVAQWLRDALSSADTLQRNIADFSYDEMIQDDWLLGAVERRLEVIGESLRRVRAAQPEIELEFPEIHQWVALRNVVAHDYDDLDHEIIWDSATVQVTFLIQMLRQLLGESKEE